MPYKAPKMHRNKSKGQQAIEMFLFVNGIKYTQEYKFSSERKFRFDLAIRDIKVGVEYEGLFSAKSRHTNVYGYSTDCTKYNLAQCEGWKVLRYTSANYREFYKDIKKLMPEKIDWK